MTEERERERERERGIERSNYKTTRELNNPNLCFTRTPSCLAFEVPLSRTGLELTETRLIFFWPAFSCTTAFSSSSSEEEWSLLEPAAGPFVNAKWVSTLFSNAIIAAFGGGWSARDLRIIYGMCSKVWIVGLAQLTDPNANINQIDPVACDH